MSSTFIDVSGLSFAWPEGAAVFDGLDFSIGPGRTGLIGNNGSGKSTLLKLIGGELKPGSGSIALAGEVGYLPQDLVLDADLPVDVVLGIADVRAALHAIEGGDVDEAHFTTVGDDWDVEERARATLDRLGLTHIDLDRKVGEVSGGESVLLGLTRHFLNRPEILLLDEPTNNLDLRARHRLYDAVDAWNGVMVIVSHDRELLQRMDEIAELRGGELRRFGGNLSAYEEAIAIEQEAAERTVRAAESDVKRQQRELIEARTKLDRRTRYGQKMWDSKREPKIVMGARKRAAQVSAGKHRNMHEDKLEQARDRLTEAEEAVRDDATIRVDLPDTEVPAGRVVLEVDARLRYGATASLHVRGPERIALVGDNGAGKSTLLRTIAGTLPPESGTARAAVPLRYLPQRLDVLEESKSIAENVARFAPSATQNEIRGRLARFLFRGDRAAQPVHTLSGGERFRATLAALLLAEPAPQLLMLDEPTNNLDIASVAQLAQALESYQGALIVASHDVPFLRELGITRWVRLDGELAEIDPM